jgi:acetyl-CoA C-acetyltransferase
MPEAVIVATSRTPIGRAMKGSLKNERPDDLTAFIVDDVLNKVPQLDRNEVEDLLLGCGQPAGESGYNLARIVAIQAGMANVPGVTINRYCSSSLMSIRMAEHAIKAGDGDVFVAAGVETVSRFLNGMADSGPHNPLYADAEARTAERSNEGSATWAPIEGSLPDVYITMGQTAENVAQYTGTTREEQDDFAFLSQTRATASLENGFWENEITPVKTTDDEGNEIIVTQDDGIRSPDRDKMATLKPVFRPDGTVTAGNACPLNDGAAAVVVMSDTKAKALGLTPLARIVSSAATGLDPEIMGLGPIEAIRKALSRANMSIDEIDLVEINEAFAAQVIPSAKELGISWDKLNVNGGAIAVGHPFGMTGARIMGTLLNGLQKDDKRFGLESMCVGGGQGMAMIVERLS